jgi:hypothetical protein
MNSVNFNNNALPFEMRICESLSNVWDFIEEDKTSNWTKAVKKILEMEARQLRPNLKIAASGLDSSDCTEWLYDFLCYENNLKGLQDVVLIVESEWRNPFTNDYLQDIQDDFEKLILARCFYRLMIFEGENLDEVKNYITHLTEIVQTCTLTSKGDRYLFAAWVKSQEFYYDVYVHE